jgi:hypothetical protein
MNLTDFRELEKELGHAPTQAEVREYDARPRLKKANVFFTDPKYNYSTSVNGKLSDEEIVNYFKHQIFNLGSVEDDVQVCINCTVEPSNL